MAGLVYDLSDARGDIRQFPDGPVEAQVKSAKMDVAKSSGNPMIVMEIEIYHPDHGTAILRDNLPLSFPDKVANFWMAVQELTQADIAAQPQVEIDPDELTGAPLIVQLGDQENKQTGKVYKTLVAPWYYPRSRQDLLDTGRDNPLG